MPFLSFLFFFESRLDPRVLTLLVLPTVHSSSIYVLGYGTQHVGVYRYLFVHTPQRKNLRLMGVFFFLFLLFIIIIIIFAIFQYLFLLLLNLRFYSLVRLRSWIDT